MDTPPTINSIHQGQVRSVQPYGFFCNINGYRRDGLVHISAIKNERVENVSEVVQVGQIVWVKVIHVFEDSVTKQTKLKLAMNVVDQQTGQDLDPEHTKSRGDSGSSGHNGSSRDGKPLSSDPPDMYSLHQGSVQGIQTFGAFIQLPGFRSNGLVHITQIRKFKCCFRLLCFVLFLSCHLIFYSFFCCSPILFPILLVSFPVYFP
jgi:predicted RNA-binding protein with RPS1 domain